MSPASFIHASLQKRLLWSGVSTNFGRRVIVFYRYVNRATGSLSKQEVEMQSRSIVQCRVYLCIHTGKIDLEGKTQIAQMLSEENSTPLTDAFASKLKTGDELDLIAFKVLFFEFGRHIADMQIEEASKAIFSGLVNDDSMIDPNRLDTWVQGMLPKHLKAEAQELAKRDNKITYEEFKVLISPLLRQLVLEIVLKKSIKDHNLKAKAFIYLGSLYPTDDQGRLVWTFPDGADWKSEFTLALGAALTSGLNEQFQPYARSKTVDDAELLSVLTGSEVKSFVESLA